MTGSAAPIAPAPASADRGIPRVTVMMAAYNGAGLIRESIDSVLAQEFSDFEMIIIDDCSTDDTPQVLASYTDPRLRILRNPVNLGVVGTRNRGLAEARGGYIAMLDQDDIARPNRLAIQVAYLDQNPATLLIGSDVDVLQDGRLRATGRGSYDHTTETVLSWMLHIGNPLGHSSVMFRTGAARSLGTYLRDAFEFCEDYDFYHRLLRLGPLMMLPEKLTICREHSGRASLRHRQALRANAIDLLVDLYTPMLGTKAEAEAAAILVLDYFDPGRPVADMAMLRRIGATIDRLLAAFLAARQVEPSDRALILAYTGRLWWRVVRASLRQGRVGPAGWRLRDWEFARHGRLAVGDAAVSIGVGTARRLLRAGR